jgi:uncharacterized protein with GYD domain
MAHYLFKASYTQEGLKGLLKEGGSGRTAAIEQLVSGMGGRVEAVYWTFGDEDIVIIAELPDNTTAAALATTVSASGSATVSTTVLLTAAEVDAASKKTVNYRQPGR